MADKDDSRRDHLILQAADPTTGGTCEVQISFARMQVVGRRSLGHAKECGYIVPQILQRPTAVFEGCAKTRTRIRGESAGAATVASPNTVTAGMAPKRRSTQARSTSCLSMMSVWRTT